jgi:hypothetical protein
MNRRLSAVSLIALLVVLSAGPQPLEAWGGKGHAMQARAAVAHLPADMPAFLREAGEEMAMLISEPDQWRTSEQPGLTDTTTVDHVFKWENAPRPLPPTRHEFLAQVFQGKKPEQVRGTIQGIGTGPYGIKEWSEMLTGAFRRWRAMPESTPAEIARKRMHERSILFMAGVVGHWVTDLSQPMHTSIHSSAWHPSAPNPNNYKSRGLHARFESTYVEAAIVPADVLAAVTTPPRMLGDWLREAEAYIGANNKHVEQIYRWDQQAAFGEGGEPADAKPFTIARLGEGATMLRDVWYTAWVRSKAPLPVYETAAPGKQPKAKAPGVGSDKR